MICYFELHENDTVKFYEMNLTDSTITTTAGKVGTKGRTTTKAFADEKQALVAFEKMQQKKIKEGFVGKTFPFPFYGAGYGHYYEWAEVVVRFASKPTKGQIEKITTSAPPPIKPDKSGFRGRMLLAGSNQFVNMYIHEAYGNTTAAGEADGKTDSEDEDNEFDMYAEDYGEFYASREALDAFEQDIERWLLETHQHCPIEFAYRREDHEAGGTELSVWHRISMEQLPALLKSWEDVAATYQQSPKEENLFKYAVQGMLNFSEIPYESVSEKFIDFFFPEIKLTKLLKKPDLTEVLAYFKQNHKNKDVKDTITNILRQLIKEKNYRKVTQLTELVADDISADYSFMLSCVGEIMYAALMEKNQPLIDKLIANLSNQQTGRTIFSGDCASCDYANQIAVFAHSLHHKKTYPQAIEMYKIALSIQPPQPCKIRLELYCNAVWVLQNDNTGLPVNKALNEAFLAKCLPYAPQNPAIYFNAAGVYVEMDDFDKAVECVKNAIKHKYNNIKMMKDQILTEKMFTEFRKYPPLIETLNL